MQRYGEKNPRLFVLDKTLLSHYNQPNGKRKRNMMMSVPIEGWKTSEEIITANPEVIMQYLSKGTATIRRDLEEMVDLELLVKDGKKYHANIAVLHASLPQRK